MKKWIRFTGVYPENRKGEGEMQNTGNNQDHYADTAVRVYKGSQILYENEQWLNACYLAGYVIECYAKRMIELSLEAGAAGIGSAKG